ncbi:hypothetical protein SARC_00782 [Sphaeroforma arctica JP610]|uniref:AAA+ ATPase domain-containing protein n=1 Tax=Sphaeroforma arctica JP610 TaxID=667725 RepID=A0A0L0GDN2_9EUKA|nr:hypothetical protein SARC_00782 [Sphaeroforma arctica JP610]KNC87107.1 hypothetical protein SARC_00782 [Sphaeroforma arctica JP610]|eukprot:XP_014161009.1 hypothetical protein SARC_00782 [Sphaeroforma arctica JP610]
MQSMVAHSGVSAKRLCRSPTALYRTLAALRPSIADHSTTTRMLSGSWVWSMKRHQSPLTASTCAYTHTTLQRSHIHTLRRLANLAKSGESVQKVAKRPFMGVGRLNRLEQAADASPRDVTKQLALLKELNRAGEHEVVIRRWDSNKFAINEAAMQEYIKALVHAHRMEASSLPNAIKRLESFGKSGLSDAGLVGAGAGGVSLAGISASSPLPVELVSTIKFALLKKVGWQIMSAFIFFSVMIAVVQDGMNVNKNIPGMRTSTTPHADEDTGLRFEDVRGCDEAKQDLEEVVEFLRNPEKFTRLGGKLPKGLLLMGPPGTGKTMLARAIAGEADVPFFYCAGSDFDEMFVGVGARRVRELFEAALKVQPCIVFIDEIDAIGGKRNVRDGSGNSRMTLNQLLVELDGFKQNDGVIVVGATNFPELLDEALIRPGRFDKKVYINIPDTKGRLEILQSHISKVGVDPAVDLRVIARATSGMSGAELSNMVNQAALKASIDNKTEVGTKEFIYALDKIRMGAENKSRIITAKNRNQTAYHEGGHALVAALTPGANAMYKATILSRGQTLGMVQFLPEVDNTSRSKEAYFADLRVAMGGRAAEELLWGEENVSSGCSSDLKNATSMATHMVCDLGYSKKIGKVVHDRDSPKSEETMKLIDLEVRRLLDEAYEDAINTLRKNKDKLDLLATALIEYETLDGEEIKMVLEGKPLPDRELVAPPDTDLNYDNLLA